MSNCYTKCRLCSEDVLVYSSGEIEEPFYINGYVICKLCLKRIKEKGK